MGFQKSSQAASFSPKLRKLPIQILQNHRNLLLRLIRHKHSAEGRGNNNPIEIPMNRAIVFIFRIICLQMSAQHRAINTNLPTQIRDLPLLLRNRRLRNALGLGLTNNVKR